MTKSARNSIAFALSAAVLVAAPVAMAQSVHPSWYSGQSWGDPANRGASGTTTYYGTAGSTAPPVTTMSNTMTPGTMSPGAMSPGTMSPGMGTPGMGMAGGGRQVLTTVPPVEERRERGQRPNEQMQTLLLNSFSGAGYVAVRDFRKDGERYMAQAQDQFGNWTMIELDPRTGSISRVQ